MDSRASLSSEHRITELDVIRGFALLGIFLVNFPEMTRIEPFDKGRGFTGLDALIRLLYDMFVQTKFYSIFAFLFGLGFYIFMSRAEANGLRMKLLFTRRLFLLLAMGLIHFIFLWEGDILYFYALMGFWLMRFYRAHPKSIFITSIVLMCIYLALTGLISSIPEEAPLISSPAFNSLHPYWEHLMERVHLIPFLMTGSIVLLTPEILGLFLLGLFIGKIRFFDKIVEWRRVIRKAQWLSLAAAAISWIPLIMHYVKSEVYESSALTLYVNISGKCMAVFYVTSIILLMQNDRYRKIVMPLRYVGRMALTNYLAQTVITVILLAIFIDNMANLPLWIGAIFSVVIYGLQLLFSKWWLSRFAYGPMEWLWRRGTYAGHKGKLFMSGQSDRK